MHLPLPSVAVRLHSPIASLLVFAERISCLLGQLAGRGQVEECFEVELGVLGVCDYCGTESASRALNVLC